jgi:hypothetical protein
MADKDLEKRIAEIEDIEAIRKLKGRYCLYVDQRNEDGWISLFTQDGVWESDKFGVHEGREAIRTLFRNIPGFLRLRGPLRDKSDHRGGRRPCDWKLAPFGAVHFHPRQPTDLGRGAL